MQNLGRRLQRELKANRKKAALLASLVLVAGWFWFPLVFKSSNAPSQPPAVATAQPTTAAASNPSASSPATMPWEEVDRNITIDPRTRPLLLTANDLPENPFRGEQPPRPVIADASEVEQAQAAATVRSPTELGLVVTSTLVGRGRRAARINGETYEEQSLVPAADGTPFRLKEIGPSSVILSRFGNDFTLTIKRGSLRANSRSQTTSINSN